MIARGGAEDKGDEPAVGISGGAFYCLAHVGINAASVLAMANELAVSACRLLSIIAGGRPLRFRTMT